MLSYKDSQKLMGRESHILHLAKLPIVLEKNIVASLYVQSKAGYEVVFIYYDNFAVTINFLAHANFVGIKEHCTYKVPTY